MSLHRWSKHLPILAAVVALAGCPATTPVKEQAAVEPQEAAPALPPPDPQTVTTHEEGLLVLGAKNYALAAELFDTVTKIEPERQGPALNKALALRLNGKREEARAIYLESLKINPANAEAYNQLGILYREAGEFNEARAIYEAGLMQVPDYPGLHLNLGILFDMYLRLPQKALLHYQKFQDLVPESEVPVKIWISDIKQRLK